MSGASCSRCCAPMSPDRIDFPFDFPLCEACAQKERERACDACGGQLDENRVRSELGVVCAACYRTTFDAPETDAAKCCELALCAPQGHA